MTKEQRATFIRNFVFGVEDSLVSTVGLISGVAIAGASRGTIFLTGIVLIFVEAFSMGVGSYLSEQSSEDFIRQGAGETKPGMSVSSGLIMFVSYFLSGFIPLIPYLLWTDSRQAFAPSIGASLAALFLLGVWGARLSKLPVFRGGLQMMIIGGIAIGLGVSVGAVLARFGVSVL